MLNTSFLDWKFVGIVLCFVILGASCKDNAQPIEKTKWDFLVDGEWELKNGVIEPSVKVEIFGTEVVIESYWDMMAALNGGAVSDCQKDDLMIFKADSSVTLDEGPTKCDSFDPQEEDGGDWLIRENDTELVFTSFPYDPLLQERVLRVINLTSTELKLEMDYRFRLLGSDSTDHIIKLDFENVK